MSTPVPEALGATTTARKWRVEVDTSSTATPSWVKVMGITEATPNPGTAVQEDTGDYDGEGYGSSTAVGLDHGLTMTVRRAPQRETPTAYDPAQEFIRLKALQTGILNEVHVRYFELEPGGPRVEAYEGYFSASWANSGGGPRALSSATITLTGQGALLSIAHPVPTT